MKLRLRPWFLRSLPAPDPGEIVATARYNAPEQPRRCGRPVRLVTCLLRRLPTLRRLRVHREACTNQHAQSWEMPIEERIQWVGHW